MEAVKQVKISVIIPHKNCGDLLEKCLASIPEREDVQVIVVDDNSDPARVDFERLKRGLRQNAELVLTKEGRGAGYARNVGLARATGEWLVFADADDFFEEGAFEVLLGHAGDECEVLFFGSRSSYADPSLKQEDRAAFYNGLIKNFAEGKEGAEEELRCRFGVPWAKMVRSRLVRERGLLFDEVKAANDVMFSLKAGFYAQPIAVEQKVLYDSLVMAGSLTQTRNKEIIFVRYKISLNYNLFLKRHGVRSKACHIELYLLARLKWALLNHGPVEFLRYLGIIVPYCARWMLAGCGRR